MSNEDRKQIFRVKEVCIITEELRKVIEAIIRAILYRNSKFLN